MNLRLKVNTSYEPILPPACWKFMTEKRFICDPKTGTCHPIDIDNQMEVIEKDNDREIIYVGDPMCSWCWGITNEIRKLKDHYPHYNFTIVVGGLRPGGGDLWNEQMKTFLKHHWEEVNKRSGQPFGYKLFEKEYFNYDTEPPCRAVVASRKWMENYALAFYEEVSRKFYVENEYPGDPEFYRSVCSIFDIPYRSFLNHFNSQEVKHITEYEFQLNRKWGVRGYPSILFRSNKNLYQVSPGYSEFEAMHQTIEKIENA